MAAPSSPTLPGNSATTTNGTLTKINIGTRRSQLAIAQVDSIIQQLKDATAAAGSPEKYEYVPHVVSTMADENQVKSFSAFDSKSIWTEELEALLVEGKLDVVVHCLKDMPTTLPPSCALGIICAREDPRDVVVLKSSSPYKRIQDLPAGSIVGTSSVRRKAQTQRHFPHLRCVDVRGNLNTRLRKLDNDDGESGGGDDDRRSVPKYDCLILAAAGLKRIGLGGRISQYLTAEDGVLYAPGQGALGLEVREGDARMLGLLGVLADGPTTLACTAERSLLRTLQGGCSAPVGVETSWAGKTLVLKSSVISPDGREMVEERREAVVEGEEQAGNLGRELAERLLEMGADEILKEIRATAQ